MDFGKFLDTFPEDNVFPFFENRNNSIRWDYVNTVDKDFIAERQSELKIQSDPYKHFRARIDFLNAVYEWVETLPDYDNIISETNKKKKDFMVDELPVIKENMKSSSDIPADIIDSFFNIYFMNFQSMENGQEALDEMLSFNIDKKLEYFTNLSNEMISFDKENDCYLISFAHI